MSKRKKKKRPSYQSLLNEVEELRQETAYLRRQVKNNPLQAYTADLSRALEKVRQERDQLAGQMEQVYGREECEVCNGGMAKIDLINVITCEVTRVLSACPRCYKQDRQS
jgi:hypothetical protein